jgi:hypothetical protein
VQIGKKEAATVLGISVAELDRKRANDSEYPKGFRKQYNKMALVRFRLSDVYTYSEHLMQNAVVAKTG